MTSDNHHGPDLVARARAEGEIAALRSAAEHMELGVAVGSVPLEVRQTVSVWLRRLAEQRLDAARRTVRERLRPGRQTISSQDEPPTPNGPAAHARQLATMLRVMSGTPGDSWYDQATGPGMERAATLLDLSADQLDADRAGTPFLLDAYGRTIREGDTVGGTTSGRYQATISGPVLQLGTGRVKVRVTSPGGDGVARPAPGSEKWISADRVFLLTRA